MTISFKSLFKTAQNELEDAETGGKKKRTDLMTCAGCGKEISKADAKAALNTCPLCGMYFKVHARKRIRMLADPESFTEMDADMESGNPLSFPGYEEKLQASSEKSREKEGVVTGTCTIGGILCGIFSMEPDFMMGSMGTVVGEKITRLFEYCTEHSLPVVGVTVSGGARMQEGMLSLSQMAKVSGAVKLHSEAGNFYLTLLTHPTTGGVTASFAMLGDVILAEPHALVCFAGPRVIEQSLKRKLPEGFGKAEAVMKCGFIDDIVERKYQRGYIADMLKLFPNQRKGARDCE